LAITLLPSVALALVGWLAILLIGRPIRDFLDLRREIRRQTLLFGRVPARFKTTAAEPDVRARHLMPDQVDELKIKAGRVRRLK
jgi:hypothetical protein